MNLTIDGITDSFSNTTSALLNIKQGASINSSTFGVSSFVVSNTGSTTINQFEIDISSALITGARFDPSGEAGDVASKAFVVNTVFTDPNDDFFVDVVTYEIDDISLRVDSPGKRFATPASSTEDDNGFTKIVVDVNGFDPGDQFGFAIDIDPISTQGLTGEPSTSVSGLELSGGLFTVRSNDGTATSMIMADGTTAEGAGEANAIGALGAGIALEVANVSNGGTGFIASDRLLQTVTLTGPANGIVRLLVSEGAESQPTIPGTLAEFESNNVVSIIERTDITLDGTGQAQVSVNLPNNPDSRFHFIAGTVNAAGRISSQVTTPVVLMIGEGSVTSTPPVAVSDTVSTNEDSLFNGNVLLDNGAGADSDADGDTLSVTAVNGSHTNVGEVVTLGSGTLLTLDGDGTFTYDPNGQFESLNTGETASDSFSYTIGDGNGGTDTATVTLTIDGVTDNGGSFNDITGTSGVDTLAGTGGDDRFFGLEGDDTILSGGGSDVFVYNGTFEGEDTITDFAVGVDLIDISAFINDFASVSFRQEGTLRSGIKTHVLVDTNSAIRGGAENLVTLLDISPSQLSESSFILS